MDFNNHNEKYQEHYDSQMKNIKKLLVVFCLTVIYMFAEFFGGFFSNSLALIADAGHMFSDAAALGISIIAAFLSMKPASFTKTYGYHRTEIFAAFINGVMLVVIASWIVYEAYIRLITTPEVKAPLLIGIATGGLVINVLSAKILHSSSQENINIRGAFFHILGDLLGSLGAVAAGLSIYFWKFYLADAIISFLISFLIFISAFRIIGEALDILLESSPSDIDVESIYDNLLQLPNVLSVHHLHVWSISAGKVAMSVHIEVSDYGNYQLLQDVRILLNEKFNITHVTVQIEPPGFDDGHCVF